MDYKKKKLKSATRSRQTRKIRRRKTTKDQQAETKKTKLTFNQRVDKSIIANNLQTENGAKPQKSINWLIRSPWL